MAEGEPAAQPSKPELPAPRDDDKMMEENKNNAKQKGKNDGPVETPDELVDRFDDGVYNIWYTIAILGSSEYQPNLRLILLLRMISRNLNIFFVSSMKTMNISKHFTLGPLNQQTKEFAFHCKYYHLCCK